jgi:hypothetical protein
LSFVIFERTWGSVVEEMMRFQNSSWGTIALIAAASLVAAGKHKLHPMALHIPPSNDLILKLRVDIPNNGGICDLTNYTSPSAPSYEFTGPGAYMVESQADLDTTLGNCTTIIGYIFISPNYTGPLIMNNVTNITRGFLTTGNMYLTGDPQNDGGPVNTANPTPLITSIQADNLIQTWMLDFTGVPALKSISMEKLESVDRLTVYSNPAMSLNFPQLINGTSIVIEGGYSR